MKQESRPAIRLEQGTAEAIRRHAARAYPDECCGALIGRSGEGCRTVVRTLAIDNARTDSARNRFLVTDRDYLRAEAEAAAHGLDLIGFYHSHPDHVARPSQFDLDHAWPVFSYVIVSVVAGRTDLMTSWILEEDRSRFRPQPLREIAPAPRPRPIPAPHPHLRGART